MWRLINIKYISILSPELYYTTNLCIVGTCGKTIFAVIPFLTTQSAFWLTVDLKILHHVCLALKIKCQCSVSKLYANLWVEIDKKDSLIAISRTIQAKQTVTIRVGQCFLIRGMNVFLDKYFARNSIIFDHQISNKMCYFDRKFIHFT